MKYSREFSSPNFSSQEISIEFAVLHYTAVSLKDTLTLFADSAIGASAHFVVDVDGTVYELVQALSGPALRAQHAGESRLELDGKLWTGFNDFSIGIELVNANGNMLEYREPQYDSLIALLTELKQRYPALASPERVVGHEHIAGHRGKVDPGACFDWARVLQAVYPKEPLPARTPICSEALLQCLLGLRGFVERSELETAWSGAFNVLLESICKENQKRL
ncbi:MAG: N-acetylmuramoyl-L-alanine amidase [Bdellovibrionales bacterium]|nr:N-acetylmuramoyl-L-alanine amidase [Bdellovibrionales bacterium]